MSYTSITVIYNPHSSGDGRKLAHKLQSALQRAKVKPAATLVATEYAGHAEELARELASTQAHPLIISASGDGGYHEVINGVLGAAETSKAVTGLLPAGYANDHHRHMHAGNIVDQIAFGRPRRIDALRLTYRDGRQLTTHYAHSYIGIGLTPYVGRELNKHSLNRINEKWFTAKRLLTLKPTRLVVPAGEQLLDSIVFSNIPNMSRDFRLAANAKVNDGLFEITQIPKKGRLHLFKQLWKTYKGNSLVRPQASTYTFTTVKKTAAQLDGELIRLPAATEITISILPKALRCII